MQPRVAVRWRLGRARSTDRDEARDGVGRATRRRRVPQTPIVFRMLPKCSSMWPRRARLTISSALMGGIPVNTVPVFASSASERPRTNAAAAAAPFLWNATYWEVMIHRLLLFAAARRHSIAVLPKELFTAGPLCRSRTPDP